MAPAIPLIFRCLLCANLTDLNGQYWVRATNWAPLKEQRPRQIGYGLGADMLYPPLPIRAQPVKAQ